MSDEVLLAKARAVSGQEPEVYVSVRTEGAGEWYFRFDDASILAVDIVEPGLRCLSVQIPPSSAALQVTPEGSAWRGMAWRGVVMQGM